MSQTFKICLLPGDGIGPEIIAEGVKVLNAVGAKYDTSFEYTEALIGGCAIDEVGEPLPQSTLDAARSCDAVLLAAVGGPKWDTTDPSKPRPEQGLLGIRKELGLYTNLRPVQIFNALSSASTSIKFSFPTPHTGHISIEESKISPQTRHFTSVLAPFFFGFTGSLFCTMHPN